MLDSYIHNENENRSYRELKNQSGFKAPEKSFMHVDNLYLWEFIL